MPDLRQEATDQRRIVDEPLQGYLVPRTTSLEVIALYQDIPKTVEQGRCQGAVAKRLPVHSQAEPAALFRGSLHEDGIFPDVEAPGPLINDHFFSHA